MSSSTQTEDSQPDESDIILYEGSQANYFENRTKNVFGIARKETRKVASDFRFDVSGEVRNVCKGYVLQVYPEIRGDREEEQATWTCFVPSESMARKSDFLNCLNSSSNGCSVMSSLQDVQIGDFLLQKKRSLTNIPEKFVVKTHGKQTNGMWALAPGLTITKTGDIVQDGDNPFVWIITSKMKKSLGVHIDQYLSINLPLRTSIIGDLLDDLKTILQDNFFPGLMVVASCIMALHYQIFIRLYCNCPVPIAFGPSGTGKTTALRCGLAIVGSNSFFTSNTVNSRAFILDMCSKSSLPIGIDDPSFQSDIEKLSIDLFNGAHTGCISRGQSKPITTVVVSANFKGSEKERYSSRCLLLEFKNKIKCSVKDYTDFTKKLGTASSAVGFCIGLGDIFEKSGIQEMDKDILPLFSSYLPTDTMPRVIPGYCTLYWFALKLLEVTGKKAALQDDLNKYVQTDIIPTILEFQSNESVLLTPATVSEECSSTVIINELLEHIITCLTACTKKEIQSCIRFDTTYINKDAIAIRAENIPKLNWKTYTASRDALRSNIGTVCYRQSRDFGQKKKEKCLLIVTKAIKNETLIKLNEVCTVKGINTRMRIRVSENDTCSNTSCTPSIELDPASDLEDFANSLLSPVSSIISSPTPQTPQSILVTDKTEIQEDTQESCDKNSTPVSSVRETYVSSQVKDVENNEDFRLGTQNPHFYDDAGIPATQSSGNNPQFDNEGSTASIIESVCQTDTDKTICDAAIASNKDSLVELSIGTLKRPRTRSQGDVLQFSKRLCFNKDVFET